MKRWDEKPVDLLGMNACVLQIFHILLSESMATPTCTTPPRSKLEDISLVSFDGTFLSDIVNPKLTSVCYDYASFGKMLAASAVKLLSGEEIPKIQQCVSRLIVRESTILQ